MAVTAADIGHERAGFELLDDPFEGRQPFGNQACLVGIAVKGSDPASEPPVMVAPGNAVAGAESLHRLVLVCPHRCRNGPGSGDENRAVLVGKDKGLLRRQLIGVADRVIGEVAARDLRAEPFAHIAFGAAGAAGKLARGERAGIGHRLVEAEPVAEAHHHAAIAGRQIPDSAPDQRVEFRRVDLVGVNVVHLMSPVSARRLRGCAEIAVSGAGQQSGTVQYRAICATRRCNVGKDAPTPAYPGPARTYCFVWDWKCRLTPSRPDRSSFM